MWRRAFLPAVAALAVTAALAMAQGGSSYRLPEPAVTAQAAMRLPAAGRCVKSGAIRVTTLPPAGVTFASLVVRAGSEEVLQLAGLSGPASVRVHLRSRSTRVRMTGTTSGGQFLQAAKTYRLCATSKRRRSARRPVSRTPRAPSAPARPKPRPVPADPGIQGGGED